MTARTQEEPSPEASTPTASPPRKRLWLAILLTAAYVLWMAYLLSIALYG